MDTLNAFAMGQLNAGKPVMVFDWNKAAQLIKERNATSASAGLRGDWEWTGGQILEYGKPVDKNDTYTYLASTWATPEIKIDGETTDCYVMQDKAPEWNASTYWPDSALALLQKESA